MSKMLPSVIIEDLKRYTFVNGAKIKGTYLHIEYIVNGNMKTKKVARRSTLKLLQEIILNIKQEVGEKNEEGYKGNYYII